MVRSYDFQLPTDMRETVDVTLAPGAPLTKRKYLINTGIGKATSKHKAGLPSPVGDKIKTPCGKVGFLYMQVKDGELEIIPP